jgi:hypothetical protein
MAGMVGMEWVLSLGVINENRSRALRRVCELERKENSKEVEQIHGHMLHPKAFHSLLFSLCVGKRS